MFREMRGRRPREATKERPGIGERPSEANNANERIMATPEAIGNVT